MTQRLETVDVLRSHLHQPSKVGRPGAVRKHFIEQKDLDSPTGRQVNHHLRSLGLERLRDLTAVFEVEVHRRDR